MNGRSKEWRLSASLSYGVKEATPVLPWVGMRVFPYVFAGLALLAAAASPSGPPPDDQTEWRDVLGHKPAAVAADASPDHNQVYADSVRAFVQRHPNHSRAREVWQRLQLEFADDLSGAGRYQD